MYEPLTDTSNKKKFQDLEEMLSHYHMHSDVCSGFNSTLYRVYVKKTQQFQKSRYLRIM